MLAIALNALYTTWRKRGTTRQLAVAIVSCVFSALLLLPAIIWYNVRFTSAQAAISSAEITFALVYVALCGLFLPLSTTIVYCLFTQPRDSNTAFRIPRPRTKRTTRGNALAINSSIPRTPGRQPGIPAPFVFGDETPWGWLIHRGGRFQGQRLDLKRAVVSIGREEDNDIWLDDETSSRYHAELSWQNGQVVLIDRDSLNGVLLNGRRMRGSMLVTNGDLIEIGSHRFQFEQAQRPGALSEQDDPLLHHMRPSSTSRMLLADDSADVEPAGAASALFDDDIFKESGFFKGLPSTSMPLETPNATSGMPRPDPSTPAPRTSTLKGHCLIQNGSQAGRSFTLDQSLLTIGRAPGCDVVLQDSGIALEHAQFSRTVSGDYVYGPGVLVNNETLHAPHALEKGDIVQLGAVRIEYTLAPESQPLPVPPISPISSPMLLRLPSRQK